MRPGNLGDAELRTVERQAAFGAVGALDAEEVVAAAWAVWGVVVGSLRGHRVEYRMYIRCFDVASFAKF